MNTNELTWICGLIDDRINEEIASICKRNNKDIGLPENVFKLPLHISMKKSFYTDDFTSVKKDIINFVQKRGKLRLETMAPICHKNMIWIPIRMNNDIVSWHQELDNMLKDKYQIVINDYDKSFKPHISLFTKGTPEQIKEIYPLLVKELKPIKMDIKRFVIGSSHHHDEYFYV